MKEEENQRQRVIELKIGVNKIKKASLDPMEKDKKEKESSSDRMQKIKDLLDNY